MRIFFLLLKTIVFIMLLGFALKNTQTVVLRYFMGLEWQAPLVFVLLVFFALGIASGVLATLMIIVRQRRDITRLKRELRELRDQASATPVQLAATAESL